MDYSGDRFIDKNNSLAKAYETDRLKGRTVVKKDGATWIEGLSLLGEFVETDG